MITSPYEAMSSLFDAEPGALGADSPRLNVSPTQSVPVVISVEGARSIVPMRWGFLPSWYKTPGDGPLLINARAETLAEKPAFRAAARTRRCLIPADGFYEWQGEKGEKTPFVIRPSDRGLIAMAGVWQEWRGPDAVFSTCAVVTCAANETLAPVHHRMPVVIPPDGFGLWLGEEGLGAARLMIPAAEEILAASPADAATRSILSRRSA